ncbi:MAG: N-acetylglucosamine kinase [Bacteroidia bacterium]|nr:N-acetylglucosamine kinase [Bacteroidia bacterium]
MPTVKLIADCGSTKAEWCLINSEKRKTIITKGISPYFLTPEQIKAVFKKELIPKIKMRVDEIFYYGTGLFDPENVRMIKNVLKELFPDSKIYADHDVMGAARALCGREKGIVCNLGTGNFSCYYNGKKIIKDRPGLGYVLGDEGSGAYLGKKVIQYYLYEIFDEDLNYRFNNKYNTNRAEIVDNVYRKPFPNSYLASFALFLSENRGHYMIENILEDGLNDFFFYHLIKFPEVWKMPVNFVGGVAYGFRDVLKQLCNSYEFELGKVLKKPMNGLIAYHS